MNSPANKTQQQGRVSAASEPTAGARVGLSGVKEQSHFCKKPLGLSCHLGDKTLAQLTLWSCFNILLFFFFLKSSER